MTERANAAGQIEPRRRGDAVDRAEPRDLPQHVRRRAAWRSVRPSRAGRARMLRRHAQQPDRADRAAGRKFADREVPREEPARAASITSASKRRTSRRRAHGSKARARAILGPTRTGAHGTPVFFIHPKDMGGVLTEIMETPEAGILAQEGISCEQDSGCAARRGSARSDPLSQLTVLERRRDRQAVQIRLGEARRQGVARPRPVARDGRGHSSSTPSTAPTTQPASTAATPACRLSPAAPMRRCTPGGRGPSASTPASRPPRNPTPSIAATSPPGRRASASPSTSPPTAATTATIRASPATSAWRASRSTASRT